MNLHSLRHRLDRVRDATTPPTPRSRKPTTAESRQEFDRILAKLESLPPDAPPHPDSRGLVEARQELDRILAEMDAREAAAS